MTHLEAQLQDFYNSLPDYFKRDFDCMPAVSTGDEDSQFKFMERSLHTQRNQFIHRLYFGTPLCGAPHVSLSGTALIVIAKTTRDPSSARAISELAISICREEGRISVLPRHVYMAISQLQIERNNAEKARVLAGVK